MTEAGFLAKGVETPVFVRFSTVLGSRGSADTVRDTRGFATKFYTDEGTFDLVGNNIPVFFIQDGIKFPDVIHAGKPHPDREIPQAQSAHDTFWDFVSLHTEAQHHTMWNMSDRGIPRSYRMMEGFGVHTFRCVNAGRRDLAGQVPLEAEARRALPDLGGGAADRRASTPTSTAATSTTRSSPARSRSGSSASRSSRTPRRLFDGIDLLDPTKIVPEELAPVQPIGLLTLNANPTNFFAETEQVAFHVGHLVPGIDVTDDPLLQARLFSYVDTQLTRLGGPNFTQIPINRPHAPVNDMLRDGFHQHAVHGGVAPYKPNSLDGGCPFFAGRRQGRRVRRRPGAGRRGDQGAGEPGVVRRPLQPGAPVLAEHDPGREGAHRPRPTPSSSASATSRRSRSASSWRWPTSTPTCARRSRPGSACRHRRRPSRWSTSTRAPPCRRSAATWPTDGRLVGIVVDPDGDLSGVDDVVAAVAAAGMVPLVIAPHGGKLSDGTPVQRTFAATRSVEFDAMLLAGAPGPGPDALRARDSKAGEDGAPVLDPRVLLMLEECYRHAKVIGAWGDGRRRARRRRPHRSARRRHRRRPGRRLRRGPHGADGRPPRLGALPVRPRLSDPDHTPDHPPDPQRRPTMSTDAIVLLKDDHKEILRTFNDFEKAGDERARREGPAGQPDHRAAHRAHLHRERGHVPAGARAPAGRSRTTCSSPTRSTTSPTSWSWSSSAMKPDDERFTAKTTVLIENVRHHIEEEEKEWFPQVREALGRKVLQEIGAEMAEAEQEGAAEPGPAQRAQEDDRRSHLLTRRRIALLLVVLGILAVLGIMLLVGVLEGDETDQIDPQNGEGQVITPLLR